jgi:hypothetical protein
VAYTVYRVPRAGALSYTYAVDAAGTPLSVGAADRMYRQQHFDSFGAMDMAVARAYLSERESIHVLLWGSDQSEMGADPFRRPGFDVILNAC